MRPRPLQDHLLLNSSKYPRGRKSKQKSLTADASQRLCSVRTKSRLLTFLSVCATIVASKVILSRIVLRERLVVHNQSGTGKESGGKGKGKKGGTDKVKSYNRGGQGRTVLSARVGTCTLLMRVMSTRKAMMKKDTLVLKNLKLHMLTLEDCS